MSPCFSQTRQRALLMTPHHTAAAPSSGNSSFLFLRHLLFQHFHTCTFFLILSPSLPAWLSVPLMHHTLEILHNNYLAKSQSVHSCIDFLIGNFRSTNIDKAGEAESIQLCISTFAVLSTSHISSPCCGNRGALCTWFIAKLKVLEGIEEKSG